MIRFCEKVEINMNSFCMKCGKPLVPGAKFCPDCGTSIAGSDSSGTPAPSVAPEETVTKTLSGWKAVGVSVGILVAACVAGIVMAFAGILPFSLASAPIIVMVIGTSIWAAFDSSRIGLRAYKTQLAAHPVILMMGLWLLWIITFPWYLVVRSKIRARTLAKRERPVRLGLAVIGAYVGVMAFLALGSAALFLSAGSSIKGIWATTNAQLAAANTSATTPTPQVATDAPKPSEPAVEQGDSSVIAVVKNGVLSNYNTTTVGKAFEGTFQNPQWKSFVSPKGTTIVEFNGTVKPKLLLKSGLNIPEGNAGAETAITNCMDNLNLKDEMTQEAHQGDYWRLSVVYWMLHTRPERFDRLNECVNLPISFQFALSADKDTFSLAYIDEMFSNQVEKVMDFIYH
jgi:hypothetical protein